MLPNPDLSLRRLPPSIAFGILRLGCCFSCAPVRTSVITVLHSTTFTMEGCSKTSSWCKSTFVSGSNMTSARNRVSPAAPVQTPQPLIFDMGEDRLRLGFRVRF